MKEIDDFKAEKIYRLQGQIKEIGIVLDDLKLSHAVFREELEVRRQRYKTQIKELREYFELPT